MLKTNERMQLQDDFFVDEYKKPTDKRLKDFKVGQLVEFKDRQELKRGVVGGFTMSDVEQVWIKSPDKSIEWYARHRADEVEFIKEIRAKKVKEDDLDKKTVKELRGIASKLDITGEWDMNKADLIKAINKAK